ncbi:MAG: hypothetical protein AAF489_16755 [Bacteroidota bacterium]
MKLFNLKYVFFSLIAGLAFHASIQAQVGIGTVEPEGILDVESSTQGIVFPRVVLTSTVVEAPVVNPNGVSLVAGTTVYNTTASNNGSNDVYPGIYSWNGSRWTPQFILEEYEKFEQTGGCMRTTVRESYSNPNPLDDDNIPGLTAQVFTPTYTGTYRIEVKVNFASGAIDDFTSQDLISLATMEGAFFFKLQGTGVDINPDPVLYDYSEGWLYCHSYGTHNSVESPALEDNRVPHFASLVFYEDLAAGDNYTFTLSNCINTGDAYFVNNGDSGTGQGYIGCDIPCTVEFTFLKE